MRQTPWYSYHDGFRDPLARLVGARPGEVVAMNSLTVNLHLMLVSFFRPTPQRFKILIEETALSFRYLRGAIPPGDAGHRSRSRRWWSRAAAGRGGAAHRGPGGAAGGAGSRDRAGAASRGAIPHRPASRYGPGYRRRASGRMHGRLRSGPRRRQRGAPAARLGRGLRGVVLLQVSERGPGRGGRLLRPRAPRHVAAAALRRLVGQRSGHPVPHASQCRLRAGRRRRRVAAEQSADSGYGAASRGTPDLREGRDARAPRQIGATHRIPGVPDRTDSAAVFELITPADPGARGCQLSIRHPHAGDLVVR